MNVVLKVSSSNENYSGGCDYAFIDLTAEVAALALRRIRTLRTLKDLDSEIDEIYYWTHFIRCFVSRFAGLTSTGREVESGGSAIGDWLE